VFGEEFVSVDDPQRVLAQEKQFRYFLAKQTALMRQSGSTAWEVLLPIQGMRRNTLRMQ
jgi:hypothetical protein